MPAAGLREVLGNAVSARYAVGAFDAMDHVFVEAIIAAAERTNTPVILMLGDFPGPDYDNLVPYAVDRVSRARVPVCLHFDHGASIERCAWAIGAGFSSVMIDGSRLQFEENLEVTRRVVELAHDRGIDVEGEIGRMSGSEATAGETADGNYTSVDEARRFARSTGVDAVAIAFGTVHGVYRGTPRLDFDLLRQVRAAVDVPLVMHGSSGLSDADLRAAVAAGINKVNAYTNLSIKAVDDLRRILADAPPGTMVFPVLDALTTRVAAEVERHIKLFGTPTLS